MKLLLIFLFLAVQDGMSSSSMEDLQGAKVSIPSSSGYSTSSYEERESLLSSLPDIRLTKVPDPTQFPWSPHGQFIIEFANGTKYIGSGTLIGSRYVLTAAHNFLDHHFNTPTSMKFYPGRNGDSIKWCSKVSALLVHEKFFNQGKSDQRYDIAVASLSESLGVDKQAGHLPYVILESEEKPLYLVGYPYLIDKNTNNVVYNGHHMYTATGRVVRVTGATAEQDYYDMNTFGGISGSGVCYEDTQAICAVHGYGNNITLDQLSNRGRRICPEMDKWIREAIRKCEENEI